MEFAAWLTATGTFLRGAWVVISSCHTVCCQQGCGNEGNTAATSPTSHPDPAESVPLTSKNEEDTAGVHDGPTPGSEPAVAAVTKQPSPKPLLPTQNDTKKPSAKPSLPTKNDIKPPPPSAKPFLPTKTDIKPPPPSTVPSLPTPKESQTIKTTTTDKPIVIPSNTNNPTFSPSIQNNPTNTNSQPNTNNPVFTFNPTNTNNPTYTNEPTFTHNPIMTYKPITNTVIGPAKLETQQMIDTSESNGQSHSDSDSEDTYQEAAPIEWVRPNNEKAISARHQAIVGGYDTDGTDLWVIRTTIESEIRPAKFSCGQKKAFVALLAEDKEKEINIFEVCCVPSGQKPHITWKKFEHGDLPGNAVVGGETSDGKPLYIGRKIVECSRCPGMIRPDDKCLYVSYEGKVYKFQTYEVMCKD